VTTDRAPQLKLDSGLKVDSGLTGPNGENPQAGLNGAGRIGPSHWAILAIAVPVIFSNASTPLLGIVDTAVMGQLGPAHLIGAVAVGAIIFDFVFWAFGFLRMGTTALAAQAEGAGDPTAVRSVLARALLVAALSGITVIALQLPISWLAFVAMPASAAVEAGAATYFDIRIWSAPLVFANYAIAGFMIGRGKAWLALTLQLTLNLSNIALNLMFVLGFGFGIAGVALGSLCAEVIALTVGLAVLWRTFGAGGIEGQHGGRWVRADILDPTAIARTLALNGNIMIRSMCLVFGFAFFTARGADQGDIILAANAIAMHFIMLSAHMLDGFAFAAERWVGVAVGARDRRGVHAAAIRTSQWAAGIGIVISLIGWVSADLFTAMMTVNPDVRSAALEFWMFAALAPLVSVASYQLDGIYIGAARGRDMRNMMIVALGLYLAAWYLFVPVAGFGNTGLWLALWVFFIARGATLLALYPALLAATEQGAHVTGRTNETTGTQ